MKNLSWGKLGPNWKGPYRVTFVARRKAYRLEELDGIVAQPWNVNNFRKYYF